MFHRCGTAVFAFTVLFGSGNTSFARMAEISAGEFRPLYLVEGSPLVAVEAFSLDRVPVTNQDYLAFVLQHPEWQKDQVPAVFADSRYLQHWNKNAASDSWEPERAVLDFPVVK